jgi:hypothetical protein
MSWLSRILQVQSIKDEIGSRVAPAVPLLEAMERNDIEGAVAIAQDYGDVKEFLRRAEAEAKAVADAILAAIPPDLPAEARAKIEELTAALPALVIGNIRGGFPAIIRGLDEVIPEEAILKALRTIGAIP